jgi:UDP-2,3-diacylglucosamine pyrophosphatase LpxH
MLVQLPPRRLRTLFVSDLHLGMKGCQAEMFLDFLRHHEAETIYLVGDIVDGWQLRRTWYWPQSHNDVVQKLLRRARNGTRLVYIPGNHDEFARDYPGTHFGGIEVAESMIHEAADGRRFLVIHGDKFDVVVRYARWLSMLSAGAYSALLAANNVVNRVRRRFGIPYWSLADWAKQTVKNAVNVIGDYEQALVSEAKGAGVDGVICGHIHHAAIHEDFGIHYVNTGDWVESCTAIGEHQDGRMEIIRWAAIADSVTRPRQWSAEEDNAVQRAS